MARDYVHLAEQGEEIGWEIRSYSASESTFECNGKQVLLIEVEAGGCTFCDGSYAHNLMGANIEGYILKWKYKENEDGLPVSEMEPVRDINEQKQIAEALKQRYARSQLNFC
ncbi:MAG: hypothetical protein HOC20_03910 [Chloroflexi bacterium]|jgi:hypothetical protein|nr:hypothetical protein [Chloroflexota bacterium]